MLDVAAVLVRQHAERDGEAVGEDARLGREAGGRLRIAVEDEHLVLRLARVERVGGGGVFVAVHGIFEGGRGPQRAALVEGDRDELADAFALRGDEFDLETVGQLESRALFLRRLRGGSDGVVADVALGRRLRRAGLRRRSFARTLARRRASPTSARPASAGVPRSSRPSPARAPCRRRGPGCRCGRPARCSDRARCNRAPARH